jgi:uridine phosphorylase
MSRFPETELILTKEGRVYHLNLKAEDIADDVIVVGDQNRVEQISAYFSKIDFKTQHREFITHTGIYNGKRLTVLSTGIGTDNIDIVMNELDAAVNIDPVKRELNPKLKSLNIVRLGTSGSLQSDIPVNGIVASSHGIGLDGLLNFYKDLKSINENDISEAFMEQTNWLPGLPYPYCIKGSEQLLDKFRSGAHIGLTATAPGFYGPQGRQIRLTAANPNLNEELTAFNHKGLRVCNFEMETSALYGLGRLLGHNCLTACVIIANRVRKEFTSDYAASVDLLIKNSLERLTG